MKNELILEINTTTKTPVVEIRILCRGMLFLEEAATATDDYAGFIPGLARMIRVVQ